MAWISGGVFHRRFALRGGRLQQWHQPVKLVGAAALIFAFLQVVAPPEQRTPQVTVRQLEHYLASKRTAKEPDAAVAGALMRVQLAEELTPSALERIGRRTRLGPQTLDQVRLLAAESVFEAPPAAEWIEAPAPDAAAEQHILSAAKAFAATSLRRLPDFLAVRTSTRYSNAPQWLRPKDHKPVIRMHFVGRRRREVTYRNGAEAQQASDTAPGRSQATEGLTTNGEFGPTLSMVLEGASRGVIRWSRWQRGSSGTRIAVFQYDVPREASDYFLNLCCFQRDEDSPGIPFRGKPGYRGEIFIRPDTGVVEKVTIKAELPEDAGVRTCSIEVEYAEVTIGGRAYACPVRGVAVLVFFNPSMKKIDGLGIEKHINEIQFDDYHKFGSSARMMPTD